jgi:RNA polymerase sigma-70 factor, ECF subfamily
VSRNLAENAAMPPSDRSSYERALRSAVLAGDERAWQTLYDDAFEGLFAYVAWRCGGMRDDAEEIVQETWLIAVRRIRAFDPEQASFLTWLRGIAANLLRQRFRRARPRAALPLDVAADDGERRREQAEVIAHTLAALPERYEAVLRAKYLDEQTVDEIAAEWGETPKAIESLLTRARQAFREICPTNFHEETS